MAPPASIAVPLLALLGSVTLQPAAAAAAADVSFPGMIAHVLQGRKTIDVSSSEWFANDGPLPTPPADHDAAAEVECGAALFTHGKVTGSIDAFDTAMSWDGRVNGTLWQRGCSMYYTEQWTEGAAQFAFNVSENPNGTEESVWRWLCQAREHGVPYATAHILDTTGETRPYMVKVFAMYKAAASSGAAAAERDVLALCAGASAQGSQECFYSDMYYGLYIETHGNASAAQTHLHRAGLSAYGPLSQDYMWRLTRVHNAVRGWPIKSSSIKPPPPPPLKLDDNVGVGATGSTCPCAHCMDQTPCAPPACQVCGPGRCNAIYGCKTNASAACTCTRSWPSGKNCSATGAPRTPYVYAAHMPGGGCCQMPAAWMTAPHDNDGTRVSPLPFPDSTTGWGDACAWDDIPSSKTFTSGTCASAGFRRQSGGCLGRVRNAPFRPLKGTVLEHESLPFLAVLLCLRTHRRASRLRRRRRRQPPLAPWCQVDTNQLRVMQAACDCSTSWY